MDTKTKRSWNTPQAYILRGAQAASGTPTPGMQETTKTVGVLEETVWTEKGLATQPS